MSRSGVVAPTGGICDGHAARTNRIVAVQIGGGIVVGQAVGVEVRMVEEVEEVNAELHAIVFLEVPVLGQLHINVPGIRAKASATSHHLGISSAKMVANQGEGCGVQDLIAVGLVIAADASSKWPIVGGKSRSDKGVQRAADINCIPRHGVGIGKSSAARTAREHAQGCSRFDGQDAVKFPSAQSVLDERTLLQEFR